MENKESTDLDTRSYLMGFCEAIYRKNDQKCKWKYEKYSEEFYNSYDTSCENSFQLTSGNCKDNDYFYCPNCGKHIEEVKQ